MKVLFIFLTVVGLGALLTVQSCKEDEDIPELGSYEEVEAFPNLSFNLPVDLQHAGDNSNRLFVLEQPGIISVFQNDENVTEKKTFLDITAKVDDNDTEEGLLGLAFHPDYANNGFFYVNYTAPSRTVVSRFTISDDVDAADPTSEFVILEFNQPFGNHNGGQIAFGPDGFLYIATGDGGDAGDPQGNGQSLTTLLGKILRIDVNTPSGGENYSIPGDNPFINNTEEYREEIFAYGLRNPWRMSFDATEGTLWAGDVGQNAFEEIDIIEKGGNYGWDVMEGNHCFEPSSDCDMTGLILPVWEYGRNEGFSVTGGYVYRGSAFPEFEGLYFYGDFGSGKIWSLDNTSADNPINTEIISEGPNVSSFGVDEENELYICAFDGKIYRLALK